MKTSIFAALIFALGAALGKPIAYAESPNNPSSAPMEEALSFLRYTPSILFKYNESSGLLAQKIVEYKTIGGKFYFKCLEPETNEIKAMYSYDGHHYYSLFPDGRLQTSIGPEKDKQYGRSWFSYNPLYNPLKHVLGGDAFLPSSFSDSESITQVQAHLARMDKNHAESIITKTPEGGEYKIDISFSDHLPLPKRIQQKVEGVGEMLWVAEDFYNIPQSNIWFPLKIACSETDVQNRKLPTSYTLTVDRESIKRVESASDDEFRVPMTAVQSVYDSDIGVYLKKETWGK